MNIPNRHKLNEALKHHAHPELEISLAGKNNTLDDFYESFTITIRGKGIACHNDRLMAIDKAVADWCDSHYALTLCDSQMNHLITHFTVNPTVLGYVKDNLDTLLCNRAIKALQHEYPFQRKALRDISRYINPSKMDSTAKQYYRQFVGNTLVKSLSKHCTTVNSLMMALLAHSQQTCITTAPSVFKHIEQEVIGEMQHFLFSQGFIPKPFKRVTTHTLYESFITKHTT